MKIERFTESHLKEAAKVLAQSIQRLRSINPAISAKFEQISMTHTHLQVLQQNGAIGMVAIDNGKILGFLLGETREDEYFGRSVWAKLSSHALAEGVDSVLYRQLYAAAGEQWMAQGYPNHYVEVPAADEAALWTWFGLGFGQQQVYGVLDLSAHSHCMFSNDTKVSIRRAKPGDEDILKSFAWNIAGYQTGAPVWAPTEKNEKTELEEGYAELASDEECVTWLAFEGEQAMGMQMYRPLTDADKEVMHSKNSIELAVGSTMPKARGKGVASVLTQHGLAYAREQGFEWCITDWRTTNLLSAAFWPKMGFVPVAHRLERRVDERGCMVR
ncbi:MAG: GNAT family N-acetyltransferase [Anaerolineaceae bacterium]|nr:GNAT family N-acetyltransferase [Anaerolineaceae bacterium]